MPKYKLTIEYDGTNFVGWQSQDNGSSIQQSLEEAIKKLSNEQVIVFGAGRTDSGVHALSQVISFTTMSNNQISTYISGTNHFLPSSDVYHRPLVMIQNFHF